MDGQRASQAQYIADRIGQTVDQLTRERDELRAENERLRAANADDIRASGWAVAVHNDYRYVGVGYTFWLFTRDGFAVKGEGRTDADALAQVRQQIGKLGRPKDG